MILIEVQNETGQSAFMTLQSELGGPLDDDELYWLTITSSGQQPDIDIYNVRKVAVAHA